MLFALTTAKLGRFLIVPTSSPSWWGEGFLPCMVIVLILQAARMTTKVCTPGDPSPCAPQQSDWSFGRLKALLEVIRSTGAGTGGALAGAGAGMGGESSITDCILVGDDTGEGLGVEVT